MEVRVGTEWEFTNPTEEQTRCLIVEWYFEMLNVTVSLLPLNDYRRIRAHAEECLDRVIPAHLWVLHGLRFILHPSPSQATEKAIKGPEDQDVNQVNQDD
jgi:hypothetical protein